MNVLDLFSGIGGFSLGLERAGMRTVAFCEIDTYCQKVLKAHWPGVPVYDDVRALTAERLRADGIAADVICGGFPCQDISVAGKGEGLAGERSGLWSEYARIIGEVRPRFVIVENVAALLSRGLGVVLGNLAALGFDAEWHCIPASAIGAPHRRDRLWLVAYPDNCGSRRVHGGAGQGEQVGHPTGASGQRASETSSPGDVANPNVEGLEGRRQHREGPDQRLAWTLCLANAPDWSAEPDVGRVAHGVPNRVDRLKGLGNAVIPQIPEIIGRAIMKAQSSRLRSDHRG